jgi:D-3-phosphoglycerate dehydrogenase
LDNTTRIAVCSRSFSQNIVLRKELLSKFSNVKFNDEGKSLNGEELIEFLQGVEGAVIALEYISKETLKNTPNLKFIGKYGVGLDKLDLDNMSAYGVQMGWTPGVNSTAVAELALGMSIDLVRKISESRAIAETGEWTQIKGKQISSLTVGILGFGFVGTKVAKLMKAFGAEVIAHDKKDLSAQMQEQGVQYVDFDTLIKRSNLLTLHIPNNVNNYHIINENVLSNMQAGSFIINTARGGLIDESALLSCLESHHIAGAGLDVFESEPPKLTNPLINRKDVIVTSHIGGSSQEAILAMGMAAIDGLTNYSDAKIFKQYL